MATENKKRFLRTTSRPLATANARWWNRIAPVVIDTVGFIFHVFCKHLSLLLDTALILSRTEASDNVKQLQGMYNLRADCSAFVSPKWWRRISSPRGISPHLTDGAGKQQQQQKPHDGISFSVLTTSSSWKSLIPQAKVAHCWNSSSVLTCASHLRLKVSKFLHSVDLKSFGLPGLRWVKRNCLGLHLGRLLRK